MRRLSGLIKYLPQDNSPKLMCWACSCSYKRALAKTKHSDPARSGILVILVFVVSVLTFWSFALRFNTSEQYLFIAGTQLFSQKRKRESQQMKKERRKNAEKRSECIWQICISGKCENTFYTKQLFHFVLNPLVHEQVKWFSQLSSHF